MTDIPPKAVAKLELLYQLVRMMLKERAFEVGKTPKDMLQYGETVREFFKHRPSAGLSEMLLNAEVTGFFDLLAAELRKMRGSHFVMPENRGRSFMPSSLKIRGTGTL
jgi:hypothetical protein